MVYNLCVTDAVSLRRGGREDKEVSLRQYEMQMLIFQMNLSKKQFLMESVKKSIGV